MNKKIGVGIVTYQPRTTFQKCFDFHHHMVDHVMVVNDGKEFEYNWQSNFRSLYVGKIPETTLEYIKNDTNIGVGRSKNKCIRQLLSHGCDYIFLIEDDIFIKDNSVFDEYIDISKKTGIQHFNFSQHGIMNKKGFINNEAPDPVHIIDYGNGIQLPLYRHCVGAFSFYTRKCLEECGLIDEKYYNACEHVDHTYEIIKKGMHPPFWYFADIPNSIAYLGDEPWTRANSTISSRPHHNKLMKDADEIFKNKHGLLPTQIPDTSIPELVSCIKNIKQKYG